MAPISTQILYNPNFNFVGQNWSLWTGYDVREGLRIEGGISKQVSDIISICLIAPGEDFIHPNFGIAPPDLFVPLSDYSPYYWAYNTEQQIRDWVAGIQAVSVTVDPVNDDQGDIQVSDDVLGNINNSIRIRIQFIPETIPSARILTFGWYSYTGAILGGQADYDTFLNAVRLDNQPLKFVELKK